ncbi:hypothetical protein ABTM76_19250, partial [Acinetobacter baumannii]
ALEIVSGILKPGSLMIVMPDVLANKLKIMSGLASVKSRNSFLLGKGNSSHAGFGGGGVMAVPPCFMARLLPAALATGDGAVCGFAADPFAPV